MMHVLTVASMSASRFHHTIARSVTTEPPLLACRWLCPTFLHIVAAHFNVALFVFALYLYAPVECPLRFAALLLARPPAPIIDRRLPLDVSLCEPFFMLPDLCSAAVAAAYGLRTLPCI